MYYSVIQNNKYIVILADGVAEKEIIELPTEELADQVAYHLQLAWNEGELWGQESLRRELDPEGNRKRIYDSIMKMRSFNNRRELRNYYGLIN
ncbi:hypothetical protein [Paenibacillus sp. IHBB 10380]|uniref:hypothetical protein n=1 Tax=Paenibacillus sp. IHBB 10380 TaxID=1566358 RepID=UPI0005CFC964|nr:hypothetical protein [Paenibacillus sp. IHBB 10380]AJS58936.1 hypothetical protein UB51_11115 [Paenibacillus sp. IHBB 10380]